MNEDSNVVRLRQPEEIEDPLTAILRAGARPLLEQAIECASAWNSRPVSGVIGVQYPAAHDLADFDPGLGDRVAREDVDGGGD